MLQTLLAALLAFLAAAALGSCSDGSCSSTGSLCLQLKGARSSSQGAEEPDFFPVHGGAGRSCRGSDAHDNLASHYIANHAASLDECKEQCLAHAACKGIDFSHTGCKLWTRSIGATLASPGSTCMRLLQDISALQNFREVDGGQGKGCRGSHPGDKQESYFKSMIASDLEECKSNCVVDAECQGVSYQSRGLCEVWVRPGGIQATADETDSICLEGPGPNPTPSPSTTSPTPMPGWEKHAGLNCYKHHGAEGIDGKDPLPNRKTVPECMEECLKEQSCAGIVMPEGDGSDSAKTCWLRRNVRKSKCRAGSPYNFWARPGANIDGTDPGTETTTCCAGYDSWPNLDKDDQGNVVATCNGCTALVETGPWQGRCDKYCESFGHECFAAAEEVEDDCAVKQTFDCDKPIEGTSDMLCSCRLPQAVDEPNCDWPGQETTTTTTPAANGPCCLPFQAWPKVDGDVTCGDCMALVLTNDFGGRCDRYCESMNPPHVCVYAAEEQEENCETKKTYACNEAITGTSDMLCKCVKQNAPASCPKPAETTTPAPNNNRIKVSGRQILVDGVPLHIKGVAWNPVPKGGRHPGDLNFAQFVEQDAKLMQEMGINAVRTYEPIVDTWILDTLWRRGIWVVNSVYNWGGAAADTAADPVKKTKDHPAILMWTIGNEWNYNGLYVGSSFFDCVSKIRDVAEVVRQYDTTHPISSIYGDTGRLSEAAEALPLIEIWGINSYRGISFGNLFSQVESATDKPMYLGEYGADAYNANIQAEDQNAQAKATERLTAEIIGKTSVLGRGPCIGGFIFEFNDEWHKDNDGSPNDHDTGGIAPGGGPYPDKTFNEEWWGLVTVDREKRKAVEKYAASELPTTGAALTSMTS